VERDGQLLAIKDEKRQEAEVKVKNWLNANRNFKR
jgi:hypothetical protein